MPRLKSLPWWLLVASGVVIGALIGFVPALLFNITRDALPAVLGLLGVIIGGLISAATTIVAAFSARRSQLVEATWVRRFEVHQEGFMLWWRVVHPIHDFDKRLSSGNATANSRTSTVTPWRAAASAWLRAFSVAASSRYSSPQLSQIWAGTWRTTMVSGPRSRVRVAVPGCVRRGQLPY